MATAFEAHSYGTTTSTDILIFENKHGISLPEDYRSFLLEYNGGRPVPDMEPVISTLVQYFPGLVDEPYWASLEQQIDTYEGRIPENYLPIANDAGGNIFLMSLREENKGEVWFWDHELESLGEEGSDYFGNMTKVADTFSDLIASMVESDTSDLDEQWQELNLIDEGRTEELIARIESGELGVNFRREDWMPSFMQRAIQFGERSLFLYLLNKGTDNTGALHYAVETGDLETVEILLEHGADINAKRDVDGSTVLHASIQSGDTRMISYLLEHGANPKIRNNSGMTPQELAEFLGDEYIAGLFNKS